MEVDIDKERYAWSKIYDKPIRKFDMIRHSANDYEHIHTMNKGMFFLKDHGVDKIDRIEIRYGNHKAFGMKFIDVYIKAYTTDGDDGTCQMYYESKKFSPKEIERDVESIKSTIRLLGIDKIIDNNTNNKLCHRCEKMVSYVITNLDRDEHFKYLCCDCDEEIKSYRKKEESINHGAIIQKGIENFEREILISNHKSSIRNVYMIRSCLTGLHKIGVSCNVEARKKQIAMHDTFETICSYKYGGSSLLVERWLHTIFKEKRKKGEFFNLSEEEVAHAKELIMCGSPNKIRDLVPK